MDGTPPKFVSSRNHYSRSKRPNANNQANPIPFNKFHKPNSTSNRPDRQPLQINWKDNLDTVVLPKLINKLKAKLNNSEVINRETLSMDRDAPSIVARFIHNELNSFMMTYEIENKKFANSLQTRKLVSVLSDFYLRKFQDVCFCENEVIYNNIEKVLDGIRENGVEECVLEIISSKLMEPTKLSGISTLRLVYFEISNKPVFNKYMNELGLHLCAWSFMFLSDNTIELTSPEQHEFIKNLYGYLNRDGLNEPMAKNDLLNCCKNINSFKGKFEVLENVLERAMKFEQFSVEYNKAASIHDNIDTEVKSALKIYKNYLDGKGNFLSIADEFRQNSNINGSVGYRVAFFLEADDKTKKSLDDVIKLCDPTEQDSIKSAIFYFNDEHKVKERVKKDNDGYLNKGKDWDKNIEEALNEFFLCRNRLFLKTCDKQFFIDSKLREGTLLDNDMLKDVIPNMRRYL